MSYIQKKGRRTRTVPIQHSDRGLIKISDVAIILNVSVAMCRLYKNIGIIAPYDTDGNLGLYNLDEIKWTNKRLRELKKDYTLKQIGRIIEKERNRR